MTELSDWKRIVLPSELASAHAQGKAEGIAEVNAALASARSTISDQEKRIAELEAERDALKQQAQIRAGELLAIKEAVDKLRENIADILGQLTSERQRWEDAEGVLQEIASAPNRIAENVRILAAHFRKYEPGK